MSGMSSEVYRQERVGFSFIASFLDIFTSFSFHPRFEENHTF